MSAKRQYDDFIYTSIKAKREISSVVHFMPYKYKGDNCCDSQKIRLIQALYELDKCITETTIEDFIWEETNA